MNLQSLKNGLSRQVPLWGLLVSGAAGIATGCGGMHLFKKRYNPGFKDVTSGIDISVAQLEKKLQQNADRWDKEREEVQAAFVAEMERMMSGFMRTLQATSNELAMKDREAVVEAEKQQETRVSVFPSGEDTWNWDVDPKNRNSSAPYVIHHDEFEVNELDFKQDTLTYYAGDDVVTDSKDVPLYDHEKKLGELRFGHGSGGDPSVVYIRNEQLGFEWEVILDNGSYASQVMGEDIENEIEARSLRHSTPKFRLD